jgi:alkanesulfonate monooxygenase SsuD/methylene tetrahydromethanopterin reductase-like flavin-dependent oxidoreductase (luciferase family)
MQFGLFTEFEWDPERSEQEAFRQSLEQIEYAEALGFDAVWLGEIHFQKGRSVLPSPLLVASAIAQRTSRVTVGLAVNVLPLGHPLRLAEDVATLDHLTNGRLEYGIGRSGLPSHYGGFNIRMAEGRQLFNENLEIMLKAWTTERFSHHGTYHQFDDVTIVPRPFQKPHPPIRMAASSEETFPIVGARGFRLFAASRNTAVSKLSPNIQAYRDAMQAHGHTLHPGDIALLFPVYVGETHKDAYETPRVSSMNFYRMLRDDTYRLFKGTIPPEHRARVQRYETVNYQEFYDDLAIYGTPEEVLAKIRWAQNETGFDNLLCWMNCGSRLSHEQVQRSMRLFAEEVMPALRSTRNGE